MSSTSSFQPPLRANGKSVRMPSNGTLFAICVLSVCLSMFGFGALFGWWLHDGHGDSPVTTTTTTTSIVEVSTTTTELPAAIVTTAAPVVYPFPYQLPSTTTAAAAVADGHTG